MAKSIKGIGLPPMRKTDEMLRVERDFGNRDIRVVMAELWRKHYTQAEMARKMKIDQSTVSLWAMRCGLELKSVPTATLAGVEL